MEKKYYNCELHKNRQCPKITDPIMQNLLMPSRKSAESVKYFNDDVIAANQMCSECDSFTPIQDE